MLGRGLGRAMGVVAGQATEGTLAPCEAAAPTERRGLRADPGRVVSGGGLFHRGFIQAVTLAAELLDRPARGGRRADDGRVGPLGRDRGEVVAAGPVAFLAADARVDRLGTDGESARPDIS